MFREGGLCAGALMAVVLFSCVASADGLPPAPTWVNEPGRRGASEAPAAASPALPAAATPADGGAVSPSPAVRRGDPASDTAAASSSTRPPVTANVPSGGIVLGNQGAAPLARYPLQFGEIFEKGKIPEYPQVLVDGTAIPTQADIKLRYPDGSVKHAILSVVLPSVPAGGRVTLTFRNQSSGNNTPLSVDEMLAPAFDFDALIEAENPTFAPGKVARISARSLLASVKTCAPDVTAAPTAPCAYWTKGQIATTIVLADHSPQRSNDFGFTTEARPVRPIFHVTFWPGINRVKVRFIGEISNPQAMQDEFYNLALKVGKAPDKPIYSRQDFVHHQGARWTKTFWIGTPPEQKIDMIYDMASLAATNLVTNYDRTRGVGAEVSSEWSTWQTMRKDLGDHGFWAPYMGTAGGRWEIGDMPAWTVRWLYSGDWRAREVAMVQADLAANWPLQVRESDPGKSIDRKGSIGGMGRTVTAYGRPSLWLFDSRLPSPTQADAIRSTAPPGFSLIEAANGKQVPWLGRNRRFGPNDQKYMAVADAYRWADPRYARYAEAYFDGWVADGAHQPDPFYLQYLLSGDYWYLEELQMWAGAQSLRYCPGTESWCRGPGAGIQDEVRGMGWVLRNRVNAAVVTPDGAPEKAVFSTMIDDAFALWEGQRGIGNTPNAGSQMWRFGHDVASAGTHSPLHFWLSDPDKKEGLVRSPAPGTIVVGGGIAPWMQNFLVLELGRAVERGFPAQPLFSWVGANLIGQLTSPDFNPYLSQSYRMPVVKEDGRYFETWDEVKRGYPVGTATQMTTQNGRVLDSDFTYAGIARAAAALTISLPKGPEAWTSINAILAPKVSNVGIEWAIVPRQRAGSGSGDGAMPEPSR